MKCGASVALVGAAFCFACGQAVAAAASTATKAATPASYTPRHLAERILTPRTVLEGERKQVTVLFADLKGSMELLADGDPEEARRLLGPVLGHVMESMLSVLGADNERVFRDVPGSSEGEFNALRAKGAMD